MKKLTFLLLPLVMVLYNCQKEEGPGGKVSLSGLVYERLYDPSYKILQSELPLSKEDVYLTYGEDSYFSDDIETDYKGYYEFKYLRPGNYTLFVNSEDTALSNAGNNIAIQKMITIEKESESIDADTFFINKAIDMNDGTGTITGKIYSINYTKNYISLIDTTIGQDERLFILYEDQTAPFNDVRSGYDGSFSFNNLLKGSYTVYALSENKTGSAQQIAEKRKVIINKDHQNTTVISIYVVREL